MFYTKNTFNINVFCTKNTFNANVFSTKNTLLFAKVMSFSFSSKKKGQENHIFFTPKFRSTLV